METVTGDKLLEFKESQIEKPSYHDLIDGTTANFLMKMKFPEPRWTIDGILPEGVTIFAGKPKGGKSVIAQNICLGVALGGKALGVDVEQGDALYLHLEDGQRRMKYRLGEMLPMDNFSGCQTPAPERLHLYHRWPRVGEGCLRGLHDFLKDYPETRVVFIDTLKKVQPENGDRSKTQYDVDYEKVAPFREIYETHNVAIVLIHHTRKMGSDDPVDLISGTLGVSGGADSFMVLHDRNGTRSKLSVGGRDVDHEDYVLEYTPEIWTWNLVGNTKQVMASDKQQAVLDFITTETVGDTEDTKPTVSLSEIKTGTKINDSYLKNKILPKLQGLGLITKEERGRYKVIPQ